MIAFDIKFQANPAERSAPSPARASLVDPRWYLAALGVGVVYAVLLLSLFVEDRGAPAAVAEPEAIPVEIVIEPPPKPPDAPPAKPEPQAQTQPPDEEPAFDAPHAANNEKTEAAAADQAAKPPPKPVPVKPPSPDPAPSAAAGPKQEGEPRPSEHAPERASETPAEVTRPSAEMEAEAQVRAQAEQPRTSAAFQLPAYESAPEFDFGSLFKQTLVAGGSAKETYLTTLYGMIMPRLHAPADAHGLPSDFEGIVIFNLDGKGNLIQRRIFHESGLRDLDKAALEAVRQAAPFPPPPQGRPVELRFTYGAK
jgi:TonB family protein